MRVSLRRAGSRLSAVTLLLLAPLCAQDAAPRSRLVAPGPDGKLAYTPYTDRGDAIPDFSVCGYGGGGVPLPEVPVALTLEPGGDDRARIQAAIDELAQREPAADGFRGAILLKRGTWRIDDTLRIATGGIVLRGEGSGEDGTVLVATKREAHNLIEIGGDGRWDQLESGTQQQLLDEYVPVGAQRVRVEHPDRLNVGDQVLLIRRGNAEWITEIGMDRIRERPNAPGSTQQWKPFELRFDRTITAIEGDTLVLDAPLVCAIDARWGGGAVQRFADQRIERVGVEHLRAVSEVDETKTAKRGDMTYLSDEDHAANVVEFGNVRHGWARDVVAQRFNHGFFLNRGAKWVTVQDCSAIDPVSRIDGGRRYPFHIAGQLNLVRDCYAREARHAFAVSSRVPGPNVFLDCRSEQDYATSEPHHRWSVGGLYDNVEGRIAFVDRQHYGSGHGWSGANYVAWNCRGTLSCESPPTAANFAIGFVGERKVGPFKGPDGWWESEGTHVEPRSLYLAQLEERLRR